MPRIFRQFWLGAAGGLLAVALGRSTAAGPDLTPESMPRVPARTPTEARQTFDIRPGFHAELVAAEPLIHSPVAVAVDESGAAYVVEMRDYSERRPEALGRIRRLTDTDGDGRYDHATVFLDNLPWPTAVTCWNGGIFLGATPDLIYAKDTNGDGIADVREVIFSGFAQRYAPFATNQLNVQALLNSLQWGLDNRIHGATSMSGGEVRRVDSAFTRNWRQQYETPSGGPNSEAPAGPVSLASRDFSFDPRTLDLRAEPGGGQHGMSFDDAGRKFVCSNSDHLQWLSYADQNAPANPFHDLPGARRSIASDGAAAEVYRRSPDEPWRVLRTKWRVAGVVEGMIEGGGRPSGYFTGATGVTIYRGDAYGPDFAGDAFIADCGSNLIHRKKLRRQADGSGWIGERAADEARREFLASTDNWFRPVQFYNAPDGCLWVVDMYRETIEHPWSIPPNLKRNLDLDSGRDRGRLWRLAPDSWAQTATRRTIDRNAPTPELVQLLNHANAWHRDTAARLLWERRDPSAQPELIRLVQEGRSGVGRRHALALLAAGRNLTEPILRRATQDADEGVRGQAFREIAVQLAGRESSAASTWNGLLNQSAAHETHEEVQLEIAFALGSPSLRSADRSGGLGALLAARSELVRSAALHASAGSELVFWEARVNQTLPEVSALVRELTLVLGRRAQPAEVTPMLQRLLTLQPAASGHLLGAVLAEGLARSGHRLAEYLPTGELQPWLNSALATVKPPSASEAAVRLLAWDARRETSTQLLALAAAAPDALAAAALNALRQHPSLLTNATALRTAWTSASPSRRAQLTDLWLRNPQGARTLLTIADLPNRTADPSTWSASQIAALRNHAVPEIREHARRLLGEPPASRQVVVDQFAPALSRRGDPAHGGRIFQERCATCHAWHGQGITLGPDLASVAANGPEKLLVAILDPNREVAPNFAAWTLETTDGETVSGIKARESTTTVTLRLAGGAESTVERARLRSLETAGRSLMPEGLEQGWQAQDLADLLAFLAGESLAKEGAQQTPTRRSTSVAGTGRRGDEHVSPNPTPALSADLASPFGLVRGPDGALWFCEFEGQRIRRLDTNGNVSTVAGTGRTGYTGDGGPALAATFNQPHELRFDGQGNLFVADMNNQAIRRVDHQTHIITTYAGNGRAGYSGDGGPATAATFRQPISLQFAPGGDLFICDIGNHVIRRINPQTGLIATFAGTGRAGPTPDGAPLNGTPLNGPRSLDFDPRADLWLVTREGNQVFRFDLTAGQIHHVAGTGAKGFTGNGGPARLATLSGPKGIAIARNGDAYLADTESHSIRRIDARTGFLELAAGTGTKGDGPDGDPLASQLNRPHGVWIEPDGTVYIGDSENHRLRRVDSAH